MKRKKKNEMIKTYKTKHKFKLKQSDFYRSFLPKDKNGNEMRENEKEKPK